MRILIIEDDPNKARQITDVVKQEAPDADIVEHRSYRSGLKEALQSRPEFIILDMSMPTYDVSPREKGGRTRPYGGREILKELVRKRVNTRVVIVTQFESFGEGADTMTLSELKDELRTAFGHHYLGTIFYQAAASRWRTELAAAIGEWRKVPGSSG